MGKLFGKAPKTAFIHETLTRSERELAAYEEWRRSKSPVILLKILSVATS